MILAFDTHYQNGQAKTVCIAFEQWTDAEPVHIFTSVMPEPAPYEPGAFYKRELPCILQLYNSIPVTGVHTIVIDGYVVLDDAGLPGLGSYLYKALKESIPVIGVAKTNYKLLEANKRALLRGGSKNPLFITTAGMSLDAAAASIQQMHGSYRMPHLLKLLDGLTKATAPVTGVPLQIKTPKA
jgi:deoxyribonuclease V